jgi:hypothetical protein
MMKKLIALSVLHLLITHICLSDSKNEWIEVGTEKFTIFYQLSDSAFIDEISTFCESEFDRTADFFGLSSGLVQGQFAVDFSFIESKISVYLTSSFVADRNYLLTKKQILDRTMEIQYNSNIDDVKPELQLKIAQIITGNMTAGPFSKGPKILSRSKPWFYYGAAYYYAPAKAVSDSSEPMIEHHLKSNLEKLEGDQAMIKGARIFKYLESMRNIDSIKNIFNLMMIVGDKKKAIAGTLGIEYDDFLELYFASISTS